MLFQVEKDEIEWFVFDSIDEDALFEKSDACLCCTLGELWTKKGPCKENRSDFSQQMAK